MFVDIKALLHLMLLLLNLFDAAILGCFYNIWRSFNENHVNISCRSI